MTKQAHRQARYYLLSRINNRLGSVVDAACARAGISDGAKLELLTCEDLARIWAAMPRGEAEIARLEGLLARALFNCDPDVKAQIQQELLGRRGKEKA